MISSYIYGENGLDLDRDMKTIEKREMKIRETTRGTAVAIHHVVNLHAPTSTIVTVNIERTNITSSVTKTAKDSLLVKM